MNATDTVTQAPRRGRPRDTQLDRRVLDAAIQEYAERGWAGFTMYGVAKRAKVGKSTLYLRWPDKETLLRAALETITSLDPAHWEAFERLAGRLLAGYGDLHGRAIARVWVDAMGSGARVDRFRSVVGKQLRADIEQVS